MLKARVWNCCSAQMVHAALNDEHLSQHENAMVNNINDELQDEGKLPRDIDWFEYIYVHIRADIYNSLIHEFMITLD